MTPVTGHFTLDRSFAVGPDRLWTLLTDPKMREAWGAPNDDQLLVVEQSDLREGGADRHRCGPADAPDFEIDTNWYRLAAPQAACCRP